MNIETPNDNFSTPMQTKSKRLGLRRNNSGSINKDSKVESTTTTPIAGSNRKITRSTTTSRSRRAQPHSDIKVNYRKLEIPSPPATPEASIRNPLQRECVSTNCRPYRLSLSKRIREKMTKKRLEFHVANEMEKEEAEQMRLSLETQNQEGGKDEKSEILQATEDNASLSGIKLIVQTQMPDCFQVNPEKMTRKDLLAKIEEMRQDLQTRREHERKVKELQDAINTWKQGFTSALKDLQEKITPHYDYATLLQHLKITKEMTKHIID